ncbi:universal stress protein [Streptomyces glaucescens]|uniref:universal stress protein n=1 Tax=Streptomyces glaucescens TaxID=1907 RepID=UPI00344B766F
MNATIVVGLDGSRESRAAAEWAAREAELRSLPLKIVHVWEPVPEPWSQTPLFGYETLEDRAQRIPREATERLGRHHPDVDVTMVHLPGRPAELLPRAVREGDLLVLGSRGLSGFGGFLVGSVGQAVIAHTDVPVVLVRAGERATDEHETDLFGNPAADTAFRPVVVGIDTGSTADAALAFAFEEADLRSAPLRAVHSWHLPPSHVHGLAADSALHDEVVRRKAAELTEVLHPWRQKFPGVRVAEESRPGSAAAHLADAARTASLVVVGRRMRHKALGPHIGAVSHAVLHHATAPVAIVAHD